MQLPKNTAPSEPNFLAPKFPGAKRASAAEADALADVGASPAKGEFGDVFADLTAEPKASESPAKNAPANTDLIFCLLPFVPTAPTEEPIAGDDLGMAADTVASVGEETIGCDLPVAQTNVGIDSPAAPGLQDSRLIGRGSKQTPRSGRASASKQTDGETSTTPSAVPLKKDQLASAPNDRASERAFQTPRFTDLPASATEHRNSATLPPGITRLMGLHTSILSSPETSSTPEAAIDPSVATDPMPLEQNASLFGSRPMVWPGASGRNHSTAFPMPRAGEPQPESVGALGTFDLPQTQLPVVTETPLPAGGADDAARQGLALDVATGLSLNELTHPRDSVAPREESTESDDSSDALLPETPNLVVRTAVKRELPANADATAKFAAGPRQNQEDTSDGSDKSFEDAGKERLETRPKHVGTGVANRGTDMFTRYLPTSVQHAASEHAVSAVATLDRAPDAVTAGELVPVETVNTAHQAVEVVLKTVEQASTQEQKSVNLRFAVGDIDLSVRVELHSNQVHTTFRTDSPELRAALSHEWQAISNSASGERTLKLVPAFVTASDQSALNSSAGDTSSRQREQRAQRETDDRGIRVTTRSRGPVTATPIASANAGLSGIAPLTSRRLHTVA